MATTDRDSPYNDPAYDITSVPSWKSPPLHGAYAPNARLSPRAMAGIAVGGVVLAASGMVAWSDYSSAQAKADVQQAQIALEKDKVDLQKQQQEAAEAQQAGQETPAQKARREAVQACVAQASGSLNAAQDCGQAFPEPETPGMANASATVNSGRSGVGSSSGLIMLGAVGAVFVVGWAKRKFARL